MQLIEGHESALEYDLLTLTHYQLRDVGGALPWGALLHFVTHLPRTSALKEELFPVTEEERWQRGDYVSNILADIFDAITHGFAALAAKGTGHAPRKVKPYPRPWSKPKTRHIGKGAIPIKDFERWWSSHDKRNRGSAGIRHDHPIHEGDSERHC